MNAFLMITLLVVIVAPAIVLVYRADRQTSHLNRVPFGFGPDSERIHDELVVLNLRRRDCA
ncbi:hypothetical protein ACPXCG_23050 [Gordonia sp. DT218]|uniref:hypothetical protein n=1 Tax=Gordonia sp. DT218 TaxID=3416659 RepID=UPI003CF1B121